MKQSDTEAVLAGLFTGLVALIRAAWRWRLEIGCAAVPYLLAVSIIGDPVVAVIAVAVIGLAFVRGVPFLEDRRRAAGKSVPRVLQAGAWAARGLVYRQTVARLRRRWRRATRTAGLAPVHVRRIERTTAGWRMAVTFTSGQTAGHVDRCTGNLASALRARDVKVYSDAEDARKGSIVIHVGTDPLADLGGTPWPWLAREQTSLWDPIPIGVDENGRAVSILLPEENVLVGGIPGVGKSNLASMIVATAANDPTAKLLAIDGKGGLEFHPWAPSAEAFATNVAEAIAVLEQLQDIMETRVADLKARGQRKIQRDDGLPLYLLAIDELAEFTKATKKKDADNFNGLLRSLVSRGRAAGIIVLGCTQKPEATTVPTSIRDLISIRVALHCRTGAASDTILGAGMATGGYDASTIPQGQPGTGYLLSETARPYRFRSFLVTDHDVAQLAGRAALREREGTTTHNKVTDNRALPGSVPVPAPPVAESSGVGNSPGNGAPSLRDVPVSEIPQPAIPHREPDVPLPANVVELPRGKGSKNAVRRLRIELELRERNGRSFRQIAEAVAAATGSTCDHHTVAAVARDLERERSA